MSNSITEGKNLTLSELQRLTEIVKQQEAQLIHTDRQSYDKTVVETSNQQKQIKRTELKFNLGPLNLSYVNEDIKEETHSQTTTQESFKQESIQDLYITYKEYRRQAELSKTMSMPAQKVHSAYHSLNKPKSIIDIKA